MKNKEKSIDSYIITSDGEVLNESILGDYAFKSEENSNSNQIKDDFPVTEFFAPLDSFSGLLNLYDINTWHKRACKIIAIDTAGKGYFLEGIGDSPSEDNKKVLNDFLNRMYPTFRQLIFKRELDVKVYGNGAIEVIRDSDGNIEDFKYFPVLNLHRHVDEIRFAQEKNGQKVWFCKMGATINGSKAFVNKRTGEVTTNPMDIRPGEMATEVLWRIEHSPRSKFMGQCDVVSALSAVYGDNAQANYNITFFKNHGKPSLLITVTGNYQKVDKNSPNYVAENDVIETIKKNIGVLTKNPHSTMVLGIPTKGLDGKNNIEVTVTPLSTDITDSSFQIYRKDNRDEIICSHGADPVRLGIVDIGKLNSSSAEQSDSVYKVTTVETRRMDIEDEWHYFITQNELGIFDWKVKIQDNDRKNISADIANLESLFNMGVPTPSDVANAVGDNYKIKPDDNYPGFKDHFINGNKMINLDNQTVIPEGESIVNRMNQENRKQKLKGDNSNESNSQSKEVRRLQKFTDSLKKFASNKK